MRRFAIVAIDFLSGERGLRLRLIDTRDHAAVDKVNGRRPLASEQFPDAGTGANHRARIDVAGNRDPMLSGGPVGVDLRALGCGA